MQGALLGGGRGGSSRPAFRGSSWATKQWFTAAGRAFVHRRMLVPVPEELTDGGGRLSLRTVLRLCLAEPLSCVLNAFERACDAVAGNNFRIHQAERLDFERAFSEARRWAFERAVIFGCGVAGALACLALSRLWEEAGTEGRAVVVDVLPESARRIQFVLERSPVEYLRNEGDLGVLARRALDVLGGRATLFLAASGSEDEHRLAFGHDLLALNGAYVAFARTPGFTVGETINATNRIVVGTTSFRREHMGRAVGMLPSWPLDELVEPVRPSEVAKDPWGTLKRAVAPGRDLLRTTVIWAEHLVAR